MHERCMHPFSFLCTHYISWSFFLVFLLFPSELQMPSLLSAVQKVIFMLLHQKFLSLRIILFSNMFGSCAHIVHSR